LWQVGAAPLLLEAAAAQLVSADCFGPFSLFGLFGLIIIIIMLPNQAIASTPSAPRPSGAEGRKVSLVCCALLFLSAQ
jgi:hypothetical protein